MEPNWLTELCTSLDVIPILSKAQPGRESMKGPANKGSSQFKRTIDNSTVQRIGSTKLLRKLPTFLIDAHYRRESFTICKCRRHQRSKIQLKVSSIDAKSANLAGSYRSPPSLSQMGSRRPHQYNIGQVG